MQLQFDQYQLMGNTVVSALLSSSCQSTQETGDRACVHVHAIPMMVIMAGCHDCRPIEFSIYRSLEPIA